MKIFEKEFNLKYNLQAMFIFEQIAGKSYNISTLFDEYVLFYSCVLAGDNEEQIEFNDFIEWCNDNPDAIVEFGKFLSEQAKAKEVLKSKKKGKVKK